MTKAELVNQLFDLSVAGYFNGEQFTKTRLNAYITNMFKSGQRLVMNIALPDGRWYFYIDKYSDNEYDYFIPDTREQEQKILDFFKSKWDLNATTI